MKLPGFTQQTGASGVSVCLMKSFLLALLVCAFGFDLSAAAAKPNVILILVDDFGYECVGANGGTSYKTPVLDKLAETGARFTHCYVQPLCTPTRVQLMTGIYNVRNYLTFGDMDKSSVTFGNHFKQAGYNTCITGKWQLGRDVDLPKKFGFDEACLWQHLRRPERYKNPGLEINGVEKDWTNGEFGPDIVNDYALDFIRRKKDAPFFLYYPMMLTHDPYVATPDSSDYTASAKGKGRKKDGGADRARHFADMVAYTDKLVGKLVAQLDELHLRENTLLVLVGDNGTGRGTVSKMGEKEVIGGKGGANRAGMHVPLIANWTGRVAAGKVCNDLVDSTDFVPTICAAAGITIPESLKLDGHSFWPQLQGQPGQPRPWYYSWYAPYEDIVSEFASTQRYKLHRNGQFFDLEADPAEKQPLTVANLTGDAATAATVLQGALDQYKDARPAAIAKPWSKNGQLKKGKE